MKGAESKHVKIPVNYQKKLPKLKKKLSRRKLIASFKETLSKFILNLFLSSVHVPHQILLQQ